MKVMVEDNQMQSPIHVNRRLCYARGSASNVILRIINVFLLICACVMGVYSLYMFRQQEIESPRETNIDISIPVRSAKRIKPTVRTIQPMAFYTKVLEKRDLFEAPWEVDQEPELPPILPAQNTQSISAFLQSIRLVGIISDDDPKVVIEDLSTRTTVIMSEGDELKEAVLHQILGEYAVFKLGEDLIELYP